MSFLDLDLNLVEVMIVPKVIEIRKQIIKNKKMFDMVLIHLKLHISLVIPLKKLQNSAISDDEDDY